MAFSPATLQMARRGRGITREEMAAVLGCTVSSIQKWEVGVRTPSPLNQVRIAKLLRVAVEDLQSADREPLTAA
jgi:transcriptional regulator with XRE-family HTH domain